ncbi:MAG: hypothetical protein J3Q66DRAFT_423248 [Benniella sp.]|nr:MAG: hypothetical protein J3Q66DRAFT_423248 [Benniella sp.]
MTVISLLDSPPPIQPPIVFSNDWCDGMTCEQLLKWSGRLPSLVTEASLTPTKPHLVRSPAELHGLSVLPSENALVNVRTNLDRAGVDLDSTDPPKSLWITFGRSGRYAVEYRSFPMLSQAVGVVSFLYKLKAMDRWLKKVVRRLDSNFETRWRAQLNLCTWRTLFSWFGQHVRISDILLLAGDQWLCEGSVDCIFSFFQHKYRDHKHGSNLFIPVHCVDTWVSLSADPDLERSGQYNWNWGSDNHLDQYRKAYAIVNMPNHWGALAIDFKSRTIAFGDSMNLNAPKNVIDAVFQWLEKRLGRRELQKWNRHVSRLSVKKQTDGGSCGVLAAMAIEFDINHCNGCSCPKSSEQAWVSWLSKNINYHRVYYLKSLSGLSEVWLSCVRKSRTKFKNDIHLSFVYCVRRLNGPSRKYQSGNHPGKAPQTATPSEKTYGIKEQ